MTQVGFYILAEQTQQARFEFACKLVEKSVNMGHEVLILLDTDEQAQELNQRLWDFKSESFIPHCLLNEINTNPKCNVHISTQDNIGHHHDALICLTQTLPSSFSRFRRLLEVVIQDDYVLDYTRKHYSFLNNRGFEIKHHDMRT